MDANNSSDESESLLEMLTAVLGEEAGEDPGINWDNLKASDKEPNKQNSNSRVLSNEIFDLEVVAIDTSCSETFSLDDGDQENRALNITENGHAKVRKVSLENDTGTPTPKKRRRKRKAKTTTTRFTDVEVREKTSLVIDCERKRLEILYKRETLIQAQMKKKRREYQQTLEWLERKKQKVLELQKLNEERHRQKQAKEEAKRKRLQAKLRALEEKMKVKNEKQPQNVLSLRSRVIGAKTFIRNIKVQSATENCHAKVPLDKYQENIVNGEDADIIIISDDSSETSSLGDANKENKLASQKKFD